jgi:hypothetical protein
MHLADPRLHQLDDALMRARDKDFVIAGYEKMREREGKKR